MTGSGRPSETLVPARRPALPFRVRLTIALIAAATVPLAGFGLAIGALRVTDSDMLLYQALLVALVAAALVALVVAYLLAAELTAPLQRMAAGIERVAAGETGTPIAVTGDDELARLAESHNRVAADAQRRNGELSALLAAVSEYEPGRGAAALANAARTDACRVFGLIDAEVHLANPAAVPPEERVPGEPLPVRATIRAGAEALGVLAGHLPATRTWQRAEQDLLELFAAEVGVALRNAELFARIEEQNSRLLELDAAKDEFLRGVSHNLQTPLTSIRAYADQLRAASADEGTISRLDIVTEQADRLTRLVRQLLTVTRIEAGALKPSPDVIALGPRVRRAWEALCPPGARLELEDESCGWLAVADPDQLDQVLWALLDNAVKYSGGAGVAAIVRLDEKARRLRLTIADDGPGVAPEDRDRLFIRFSRGSSQASGGGTGLGLYVSRELAWAMGGDLWLEHEPPAGKRGAAFTLALPGEMPGDEG